MFELEKVWIPLKLYMFKIGEAQAPPETEDVKSGEA
jgi:hypothetical protein